MKLLYALILLMLATSCGKTKLYLIDQDNYNDYSIHTNPKLVIPNSFNLPKPQISNDIIEDLDLSKLSPAEKSIIKKTDNFNKESKLKQNLNKRENILKRAL